MQHKLYKRRQRLLFKMIKEDLNREDISISTCDTKVNCNGGQWYERIQRLHGFRRFFKQILIQSFILFSFEIE